MTAPARDPISADRAEVWLVRHGETTWNAAGRWQGQAESPLSDLGREQARLLALRLAGIRFDLVATSDLSRARDTAIEVAARLDGRPDPVLDARLREIHVGTLSGLTTLEAQARNLVRHRDFHDPHEGGESRHDVTLRAGAFLAEAAERYAGGRVLAVTHGGTIRGAVGHALGEPQSTILAEFGGVGNTAITRLLVGPGGRGRMLVFNDTAHLEDTLSRALATPSPLPQPEKSRG